MPYKTVHKGYFVKSHKPVRSGEPKGPESRINLKWNASLLNAGPFPVPSKRFYRLETLNNAIQQQVLEKNRFLWTGLNRSVKGAALSSLLFDLVYEDPIRLVYIITAVTPQRKRVEARLVVAKNHEECSAALARECALLETLGARAPGRIFVPEQQGLFFLPDRHHRKEVKREIFAYLGAAPEPLTPLYVVSSTQLGPHGSKPLRYSVKETETLKCSLVGLLAGCYDEATFSGVDVNDLAPECLSVAERTENRLSLVLTQCPMIRKRLPSGRFIQKLVFGTLRSGKTILPVAPARPDLLFQALANEVGGEKARAWCHAFTDQYKRRGNPPLPDRDVDLPGKDYIDALADAAGL